MNTKIEKVILQNLANDDVFMRKVIPFLQRDYFIENTEKIVYEKIKSFIDEYNVIPTKDALVIAAQNDKTLNEDQYKEVVELIHELEPTDHNKDWLYKFEYIKYENNCRIRIRDCRISINISLACLVTRKL